MSIRKLSCFLAFCLNVSLLSTGSAQAGSAGKWIDSVEGSRRTLSVSLTETLLGKVTPVTVTFACDPTWDKESSGTLGVLISVKNTNKISAFPFRDFEGPDAVAVPEIRLTLNGKDLPPRTFKTSASGSFFDENIFNFDSSEVSKKSKSVQRSLLQALADNAYETLTISILPPGKPEMALNLTLSVAGRQAGFQSLLTGLK